MPTPELAAIVVSSLTTYLAIAGESFAKEIGKAASGKVQELYKAVKERFSSEETDANASRTFNEFEKQPDEWIGPMKSDLAKIMSEDPEFEALLDKLVNETKEESKKAGTENNFTTMVTGGYVGKITNIGTIEGNVDL